MAVKKIRINEAEDSRFNINLKHLDLNFAIKSLNDICSRHKCEITYVNITENGTINMEFKHTKSAAVDYVIVEDCNIQTITSKDFVTYFKKDHMAGIEVMNDLINIIPELVTDIKLLRFHLK